MSSPKTEIPEKNSVRKMRLRTRREEAGVLTRLCENRCQAVISRWHRSNERGTLMSMNGDEVALFSAGQWMDPAGSRGFAGKRVCASREDGEVSVVERTGRPAVGAPRK